MGHCSGTGVAGMKIAAWASGLAVLAIWAAGPMRATGGSDAPPQKSPAATERAVVTKPVVIQHWPSLEAMRNSEHRGALQRAENYAIRKDLRTAAKLAVESLAEHQDWDRCRRPPLADPANRDVTPRAADSLPELYWEADVLADGTGQFGPVARRHGLESGVSHVIGRSLWAMLLAEETMGITAPEKPLDVLTRYAHEMYANPDHLGAFFDPDQGFRRAVICHDLREGFLGLLALARVRRDPWATEELKQVLAALEKATDDDGHLSSEKAKQAGSQATLLGVGNDATTCGRLVEPLVEYSGFTGEPRALRLAGRYARATLKSTFDSEGHFREVPSSGGHIHSITSSLCGILRYAIAAKDEAMLQQGRRILDVGVAQYASSWGWVDEVMPKHPANEIGRGEINQVGDVIRAALVLGSTGRPEYYELAERYLRSTLLPVQHRAEELGSFLKPTLSPKGDWQRDVPARVVGGYAMFLPNARVKPGAWPLTTPDIISGAVHALCAAWQERCRVGADAVRVNLLMDYSGPELVVHSGLPLRGRLELKILGEKRVFVRVPSWVDTGALRVDIDGKTQNCPIENGYVKIESGKARTTAVVEFPLACKVQEEVVDGTRYTTCWVGGQLIEILPRGTVSPLPF